MELSHFHRDRVEDLNKIRPLCEKTKEIESFPVLSPSACPVSPKKEREETRVRTGDERLDSSPQSDDDETSQCSGEQSFKCDDRRGSFEESSGDYSDESDEYDTDCEHLEDVEAKESKGNESINRSGTTNDAGKTGMSNCHDSATARYIALEDKLRKIQNGKKHLPNSRAEDKQDSKTLENDQSLSGQGTPQSARTDMELPDEISL